ncbi:MAG: hypothetical protein JO132_20195 [Streptosporangiaceae bacterium]|nr:hypothetical protein [Streptosporangiaceae bacterium]
MNNTHDWAGRAAAAGESPAAVAPGPARPGGRSRRGRMLRWGTGITLAAFLAGGGIAWAVSGSGATPAADAAPAGGATAAPGAAQAAVLNSALNSASSPAVSQPRLRWALARLRALAGVDGEFTVRTKTGFRTVAFERGTIESVSGNDVVIRAADGTTWTWTIVSDTVVRQDHSKTTASALSDGETVFAAGPVAGSARDARLIIVKPAAAGSGKAASGSSSGQASTS